jgi:hypothetical protein
MARYYFNWAVIAHGLKDYKRSLHLLAECCYPMHEARRLGNAGNAAFAAECQELDDDIFKYTCCAQSTQARVRG